MNQSASARTPVPVKEVTHGKAVLWLLLGTLFLSGTPLWVKASNMDPATQAFLRVTLPLSISGVFAGSLLSFIPAVGDYLNAELLGSRNTTMIGNVIQRLYLVNNDYPQASALSLILMLGILVSVFLYRRLLRGQELTV